MNTVWKRESFSVTVEVCVCIWIWVTVWGLWTFPGDPPPPCGFPAPKSPVSPEVNQPKNRVNIFDGACLGPKSATEDERSGSLVLRPCNECASNPSGNFVSSMLFFF